MEKPIIIAEREMKEDFVNVLNKHITRIPASIIASALKAISNQVDRIAEEQYERALAEYNSHVKEESDNGKETNN